MANFKIGTEIEVRGFSLTGAEVWYPAKIGRVARESDKREGWHPITYPDGAKLMCHESGFRALAPAGWQVRERRSYRVQAEQLERMERQALETEGKPLPNSCGGTNREA